MPYHRAVFGVHSRIPLSKDDPALLCQTRRRGNPSWSVLNVAPGFELGTHSLFEGSLISLGILYISSAQEDKRKERTCERVYLIPWMILGFFLVTYG